jgi:taurine transport system permease protein
VNPSGNPPEPPQPPTPPPTDDPVVDRPVTGRERATLPQAPQWWRSLRSDAPVLLRFAIGGTAVAMVLLVWWLFTRGGATEAWVSPSKLPSPGSVFASLGNLIDRDLSGAVLASLRRVLVGLTYAVIIGVGLGIVAGSMRAVAAALGPIVVFLRSVPMGALLPLTLMWFSIGETQKEMFIFLAVVPFLFSDTLRAISAVPQRYVETAETLGASKLQIVIKVLMPLALPDLVSSLRFMFGLAFGYIMLAEAIDTETGIGALLITGERRGLVEQNYLLLFVLAIIAFSIDAGVRYLQRGVFPYRKDL